MILTRPADAEKIYFLQRSTGAGLAPMDCFLVSRGIKTLAVRMKQHDANGRAIARFLEDHPRVKRVLYPGLPSHPQHEVAVRQQRGFGAMISFDVVTLENARKVLNHVKLCSLAESLGGVETLISHPATMTHASVPPEVRQRIGITDGLIRISVGIEDVEDLIADLDQALRRHLSSCFVTQDVIARDRRHELTGRFFEALLKPGKICGAIPRQSAAQ